MIPLIDFILAHLVYFVPGLFVNVITDVSKLFIDVVDLCKNLA